MRASIDSWFSKPVGHQVEDVPAPCCGNCDFYKRDYKCMKDTSAYITSTSERTYCKLWSAGDWNQKRVQIHENLLKKDV